MTHFPATDALVEIVLPAVPTSVREARVAVCAAVSDIGIDQHLVDDIRLCVTEAVANSVRHAYGAEPGTVRVVVRRLGDELIAVVCDQREGIESTSRAQGEETGFGLEIIGKLTHRHALSSAPSTGTELRMTFALSRTRSRPDARAVPA